MIVYMSNLAEQSQDLAQAGMPPAQAEAVAKAIHDLVDPLARKVEAATAPQPEALEERMKHMATTAEMSRLHGETMGRMNELHKEILNRLSETQKEISGLAAELAETRGEFRGAKWVLVGILVAVASAAAKYIFFPVG